MHARGLDSAQLLAEVLAAEDGESEAERLPLNGVIDSDNESIEVAHI